MKFNFGKQEKGLLNVVQVLDLYYFTSLDITAFLLILTVPSCHPEFSLAQGGKSENQRRNLMV